MLLSLVRDDDGADVVVDFNDAGPDRVVVDRATERERERERDRDREMLSVLDALLHISSFSASSVKKKGTVKIIQQTAKAERCTKSSLILTV